MAPLPIFVAAALTFTILQISQAAVSPRPACRCLPGDSCWPNSQVWGGLNTTVGGRLVATVPLAAPCHNPTYNAAECSNIANLWTFPNLHEQSPSSIMNPWQQNGSCDPFTPHTSPCLLGNYVSYSINVTTWQDAAAGIEFAQKNNVRLVVKNTGHDYLGKSTGKGALGLWMHNLKSTEIITRYQSNFYSGTALKIGAGVIGAEAYEAAQAAGLRVVGGSCPSVGLAGGFSQGGGHSILSSQYGLGADQVLEWEVVTATGDHVIATPSQNADLYWALSGGGPGTYGVVISMTIRVYEDGPVGGASLSFASSNISKDTYWNAIAAWQSQLPAIVDAGATAIYTMTPAAFEIAAITAPGKSAAQVTTMLEPYTKQLTNLGIKFTSNVTYETTFLAHYTKYLGPLPYGPDPTAQLLGGRLVPRSVVENNNDALIDAMRSIVDNSTFYVAATALSVSQPSSNTTIHPISANAVLPAWRSALLTVLVPSVWDFTQPRSVEEARESQLTDTLIPALTTVTPGSGTYMNEADFHLATWKQDFYGANYARLRGIKAKYDPGDLFYATTAVGSDAWDVADDGRMCRV